MAQKPKVEPHVGRLGYLQALVTEFQETENQGEGDRVGVGGRGRGPAVTGARDLAPVPLFCRRRQGASPGQPRQLRLRPQQLPVSATAAGPRFIPRFAVGGE